MRLNSPVCFYIDDSGSRNPDRKPGSQPALHDWFALGGVLIFEEDTDAANAAIDAFLHRWPQIGEAPLHSSDIRNRTGAFRWLASASATTKSAFMNELSTLMTSLPITAHACVVDRVGYNSRYLPTYGRQRWQLCKTAFNIAVERAAKYAMIHNRRLRVFVENSDKKTEKTLKNYYDEMRESGAPFDPDSSARYNPLEAQSLNKTLLEFKVKTKSSRLMQIADLALWPVCKGGYDPQTKAYLALAGAGKLIDTHCTPENGLHGIKYSCFQS